MRSRILPILFILPMMVLASACEQRPENLLRPCVRCNTFMHDGLERSYYVAVPDDLPANAPLVLFLHGYYGKADQYSWYFRVNQWAKDYGVAICVPQGTLDENGDPFWNSRLTYTTVDDMGFLTSLVKELQEVYDLDPARTFTSGISNGGFMSYALVSEYPELFKAAASVIGTMGGYTWENRSALQPTPILQLSLTEDETVPLAGNPDTTGGWGGAPGMDTIVDYLSTLNATTNVDTLRPAEGAVAYHFTDGPEGNDVWYYKIDGFPHGVPRKGYNGIVPLELILQFFSKYMEE